MVAQIDDLYRSVVGRRGTARRLASYGLFEGRPATTRGQWFNPVVAANLALGERRRPRAADRPVFILGVGRSGTTHLGKLLSAHPEVGWLNEPKLMWSRLVEDEDVSGFYQPHGRFVLGPTDATAAVRRRAESVIRHYLRSVGATRLVDKYPEMTYRASFLKALFPDAVLIAIVRRPEDFVNSVAEWNDAHTAEVADATEDWWGVDGRKWQLLCEQLIDRYDDVAAAHASLEGQEPSAREKSATEWVVGMRALMEARPLLDLIVRFEELATEPTRVMTDVLTAAGLPLDPRVLELARRSTNPTLRTDSADFGVLAPVVESVREEIR